MRNIEKRAEQLASRSEHRVTQQLLEKARDAFPDLVVEAEGNRLLLAGRKLGKRMIVEAQLRFLRDALR